LCLAKPKVLVRFHEVLPEFLRLGPVYLWKLSLGCGDYCLLSAGTQLAAQTLAATSLAAAGTEC
jgi:hypothetical protein